MVAGLQKPTFAKSTSSTRTTTSAKLATSDRSNAYSKANPKQSNKSAISYGVLANRNLNPFDRGKMTNYRGTISSVRHGYNDYRAGLYAPMPQTAPAQSAGNNSGMSSLDKFALGMQALNTLTDSLGQILDLSKSGKSSKSGNSSNSNSSVDKMNGAKDNNNAGKAAIDGMENAKDSTALKEAIGNANGTLEELGAQESELMEQVTGDAKKGYEQAKGQLKDKQADVKAKEKSYKELAGNLKQQKANLAGAKQAKDSAENQCSRAAETAGQSAKDVTTATTALGEAKSTLASIPEKTMQDGKEIDNPAYTAAKEEVSNKERALSAAKEKLTNDQKVEAKAKEDYNKAQQSYETQTDRYAQTEKKLKDTESQCEQAEKDFKAAKEELEKLQETVDKFEQAQKQLGEVKEQKEKLQAQIEKQKARLLQLQKKDKSDLEKIQKQIADLDGKISKNVRDIDSRDGLDAKENRALKKNTEYEAQRAELVAQAGVLEQRIAEASSGD